MLSKRILACLDVAGERVVKGVQFANLRDAGDPAELARAHAEDGADEVVLLDITATGEGRKAVLETVRRVAQQIFVPFTAGGGIRTLEAAAEIFECGADKVSINSAAITHPDLISQIAGRFGSQAVIVAMDARRGGSPAGNAEVHAGGGRKPTGKKAVAWAREAQERGAGEILLTSIDRDGTRTGFDCVLTAAVADAVSIPVIASGGAGNPQHFVDVLTRGQADAALAASILHFPASHNGMRGIAELKHMLRSAGIPTRWPC